MEELNTNCLVADVNKIEIKTEVKSETKDNLIDEFEAREQVGIELITGKEFDQSLAPEQIDSLQAALKTQQLGKFVKYCLGYSKDPIALLDKIRDQLMKESGNDDNTYSDDSPDSDDSQSESNHQGTYFLKII